MGIWASQPTKIPVHKLLDVLEGDLFKITEDNVEGTDAAVNQNAIREHVWGKITGAASSALEGLSLGDLVDAYEKQKMKDRDFLYLLKLRLPQKEQPSSFIRN